LLIREDPARPIQHFRLGISSFDGSMICKFAKDFLIWKPSALTGPFLKILPVKLAARSGKPDEGSFKQRERRAIIWNKRILEIEE